MSAGLILLLLGAVPLFLNALDIILISSTWFNALLAALTVLGVAATFGQWAFSSGWHFGSQAENASSRQRNAFRRQISRSFNKSLSKGILVVFTEDHEVGYEVSLVDRRSWVRCPPDALDRLIPMRRETIKRYRVRTGCVCAAVLCDLDPGDYTVWLDISQPISVSVFVNEVAIVDQG